MATGGEGKRGFGGEGPRLSGTALRQRRGPAAAALRRDRGRSLRLLLSSPARWRPPGRPPPSPASSRGLTAAYPAALGAAVSLETESARLLRHGAASPAPQPPSGGGTARGLGRLRAGGGTGTGTGTGGSGAAVLAPATAPAAVLAPATAPATAPTLPLPLPPLRRGDRCGINSSSTGPCTTPCIHSPGSQKYTGQLGELQKSIYRRFEPSGLVNS